MTASSSKPAAAMMMVPSENSGGGDHEDTPEGCSLSTGIYCTATSRPEKSACPDLWRDETSVKDRRSNPESHAIDSWNGSHETSYHYSNFRGSKSIGSNVVVVINKKNSSKNNKCSDNKHHNSECGDSSSRNCQFLKSPECFCENGPSRSRRTMGVLLTEKHRNRRGEECCNCGHISAPSPLPASLPSLPLSPENSCIDASSDLASPPSLNTILGTKIKINKRDQHSMEVVSHEEKKDQEILSGQCQIGADQRSSSGEASISANAPTNDNCLLSLALPQESNGDILVHPSVTVTVFSGVGEAHNGLKNLTDFTCNNYECGSCLSNSDSCNKGFLKRISLTVQKSPQPSVCQPTLLNETQHKHTTEQEQSLQCRKEPQDIRTICCKCGLYHNPQHHCLCQQLPLINCSTRTEPLSASPKSLMQPNTASLSQSLSHSSSHGCSGSTSQSHLSSIRSHSDKAACNNSCRSRNATNSSVDATLPAFCSNSSSNTFPLHGNRRCLKSSSSIANLPAKLMSSLSPNNRQQNPSQGNLLSCIGSKSTTSTSCSNKEGSLCNCIENLQPSNSSKTSPWLSSSSLLTTSPVSYATESAATAISLSGADANTIVGSQGCRVDQDKKCLQDGEGSIAKSSTLKAENVMAACSLMGKHQHIASCRPKSASMHAPPLASTTSKAATVSSSSSAFLSTSMSIPSLACQQKQLTGMSSQSSTPSQSRVASPSPTTVECKWRGCPTPHGFDPSDLLEHIRQHAEDQITRKAYACLWSDCKVYNKPSWSGSWLERHIVSHSGHRPFKCILDNCGQRFHSQAALERHVNSHFGGGQANSGGTAGGSFAGAASRSRDEITQHRGALKRKRQLKQRCAQTVCKSDFFDEQTMSVLRQDLVSLAMCSGLDLVPGACTMDTTFDTQIIGRRTSNSGNKQLLLEFSPPDILEDVWISEEDVEADIARDDSSTCGEQYLDQTTTINNVRGSSASIPMNDLPCETVSNLQGSLYRRHRFRKQRRK